MSSSNYSRHPARILMINLHSLWNAGDAALSQVAIQQLIDNFPECHITLSINEPDSYQGKEAKVGSFFYWIHTSARGGGLRWNYFVILQLLLTSLWSVVTYRVLRHPCYWGLKRDQKKFLQAYFFADLVISAPGNFIYSSGKAGLTFLIVAYTMAYALLAGKPLYLFPQSIGPLRRFRDQKLVMWILNRAQLVMVREPISLQEIHKIGVNNPHCRLVPDLAFSFQGESINNTRRWLHDCGIDTDQDRPLLGLTVINWGAQTSQNELQYRYENALSSMASYFLETTNGKVVFFPQVCSNAIVNDDRIPSRRVIEHIRKKNECVVFIDSLATPGLLRTAYGMMDMFVGTRMHSNIFALAGGVPVVAIAYRHKTQGIMQMMGLEDWVVDIDKVSSEVLIAKLTGLWAERQLLSNHIREKVADLARESKQAGAYIALDYASISHI